MNTKTKYLAIGIALGMPIGATIALMATNEPAAVYRDGQVIEWHNTKTGQTCRTRIMGNGDNAMGFSEGCE